MWYLLTLAGLNFFDGLFTFWGLSNNWIDEANPFMRWLWTMSPYMFLGFKTLLSVALVLVSFHFHRFSFQQVWRYGITVVNIVYSGILFLHIYWISYLFK
jgi:hypothetical protein